MISKTPMYWAEIALREIQVKTTGLDSDDTWKRVIASVFERALSSDLKVATSREKAKNIAQWCVNIFDANSKNRQFQNSGAWQQESKMKINEMVCEIVDAIIDAAKEEMTCEMTRANNTASILANGVYPD